MKRDITADEFYRLRDDRTNRIVGQGDYHKLRVRLVADQETVQTYNGQVQLLLAANMLARWCRQAEYGFPDAPLAPSLRRNTHTRLHERLIAEVREADPFGDFHFQKASSSSAEYTLKVGSATLAGEDVDFTVDAGGWYVYASRGSVDFSAIGGCGNPAIPAFAACVGVADAFKVATGLPAKSRVQNTVISLLDLSVEMPSYAEDIPTVPVQLNLGNTQIVGVGSVGSAVIYLMGMLPVLGNFLLVDLDTVKYVNLNRSPLFGISDVGKAKVAVAEEYLRELLPVRAFHGRYDEYIQQHGRAPGCVDLLLPLANEYGVRATIENNYPPLQVYGTTASDWGINYHRHIPLQEDCSLCRFPLDAAEIPMACSGAQVKMAGGQQVDAALPFLSVAAAALTVADLLKLHLPGYPFSPNFAFVDFKGNLEFINAHNKRRRQTCICVGQSQTIHESVIGSTAFSGLSIVP